MAVVHRLNVHERDCVSVLVADRDLCGSVNEIAESAVGVIALVRHINLKVQEGCQVTTNRLRLL
jgi:hypothetical protein